MAHVPIRQEPLDSTPQQISSPSSKPLPDSQLELLTEFFELLATWDKANASAPQGSRAADADMDSNVERNLQNG